jgi:hypothetical protein
MLRTSTKHWGCPTGWSTSCQVGWGAACERRRRKHWGVPNILSVDGSCAAARHTDVLAWNLTGLLPSTGTAIQGGQHRVRCVGAQRQHCQEQP